MPRFPVNGKRQGPLLLIQDGRLHSHSGATHLHDGKDAGEQAEDRRDDGHDE